ncbi:MAG: glycosyltransferase family 1 protein [Terriglobia bacterium]
MKVALDIRKLNDFGIGTYIRNLVVHLAKLDKESSYFLVGIPRDTAELGPLPPNFSFIAASPLQSSLWNECALPILLKKNQVQVLHTPHYTPPYFLFCKSIITIHDCVHILFPVSKESGGRAKKATRRAIKRSSHVFTVSEATQRDLIRLFGLPEEKISVVYNAIDERVTLSNPPDDDRKVLERYQIHDPFLLYAGNIKPHKNLERLIEAFSVLKGELKEDERWKSLKLVIIGDELSKRQALRRTVIRSGVQHDVRFFGFVPYETLRVFYKSAEVFVFPSLYEGFGLPPLEAMATGTPVLTSNISSLPEVLEDAALFVNPENVFEICKGIKHLLYDTQLRTELIEKGFHQSSKYSWSTSAQLVLETYRKIAGNTSF